MLRSSRPVRVSPSSTGMPSARLAVIFSIRCSPLEQERLEPRAAITAGQSTRLIALLNPMDPKLVAAVFGMDAESVMIYLADHVGDSYLQAFPGPEGEMSPDRG
jgi:hypothetical protein